MIASLLFSTASAAASTSAAPSPTASATATAAPPAPTKAPSGPFPAIDEKICKKEEYDALSEKVSKVLANTKDVPGLIKAIGEVQPDFCKTDCGKSLTKGLKDFLQTDKDLPKEVKDAFAKLDCNNAYITKASLALLLLAVF
jgi:hypothetical protein